MEMELVSMARDSKVRGDGRLALINTANWKTAQWKSLCLWYPRWASAH